MSDSLVGPVHCFKEFIWSQNGNKNLNKYIQLKIEEPFQSGRGYSNMTVNMNLIRFDHAHTHTHTHIEIYSECR